MPAPSAGAEVPSSAAANCETITLDGSTAWTRRFFVSSHGRPSLRRIERTCASPRSTMTLVMLHRGLTGAGCALALGILAGFLAPAARAHGNISPQTAQPGATQQFEIVIPNWPSNVPITGLRLTPPDDVSVEPVQSDDGWATTFEGRTLVWAGATVDVGREGRFAFRARLPAEAQTITFQAEEIYRGYGPSGLFPLHVTPSGQVAAPSTSERRLMPVVLVVASLVALSLLAIAVIARRRGRTAG